MEKALIIYDGDCIFCSKMVQFILKYNASQNLLFTHNSSDEAKIQKQKFGIPEAFNASIILIQKNKYYLKSKACFIISKYLKFPFYLFYYYSFLPLRYINDIVYDIISKNRNVINLNDSSCLVVSESHKHRFV